MKKTSLMVTFSLFLLVSFFLTISTAFAAIIRSVPLDKETLILTVYPEGGCQDGQTATIPSTIKAPDNGSVRFEIISCGSAGESQQVFYTPNTGFSGGDSFEYSFDWINPSISVANLFNINVGGQNPTNDSNGMGVIINDTLKTSTKSVSTTVVRRISHIITPKPVGVGRGGRMKTIRPNMDRTPSPQIKTPPGGPNSSPGSHPGSHPTMDNKQDNRSSLFDHMIVTENSQSIDLTQGIKGLSAGDGSQKKGIWLAASSVQMEDTLSSTEYDGGLFSMIGGGDYRLMDNMVIGVALSAEYLDMDTGFNGGTVKVTGYQVTPYIAYSTLDDRFAMDLIVGYGMANSETTRKSPIDEMVSVTGSIDSQRIMVSSNISYYHLMGDWTLSGNLGYLWAQEIIDSYTESDGTESEDSYVSYAQVSPGVQISYYMDRFEPFMSANYSYDAVVLDTVVSEDQEQPSNDRTELGIAIGTDIYLSDQMTGTLEANKIFMRDNFNSTSFMANFRMEF